ncbi:hypothetical protein EST38_g11469 [Candolleomyces aberdarensis]|uniref:Uncharacterized protein n=1 Tax=Candolleomyces aberdarensis TaxID=2316362 RepID=A0A4Q2D4T1_9AGAR|nr:hypothetical protein EST38_g11469 [Candolleomyces aberdarensis]
METLYLGTLRTTTTTLLLLLHLVPLLFALLFPLLLLPPTEEDPYPHLFSVGETEDYTEHRHLAVYLSTFDIRRPSFILIEELEHLRYTITGADERKGVRLSARQRSLLFLFCCTRWPFVKDDAPLQLAHRDPV